MDSSSVHKLWQIMPAVQRELPAVRALELWTLINVTNESSSLILKSLMYHLLKAEEPERCPLVQAAWALCMHAEKQSDSMADCRQVLSESAGILLSLAESDDVNVRNGAWECLGFSGLKLPPEVSLQLLSDRVTSVAKRESPEVRALELWTRINATHESSPLVLKSLMYHLVKAEKPEQRPLIQAAWAVCMHAVERPDSKADCQQALSESANILLNLTKSDDVSVRNGAWGCLGFSGLKLPADALLQLLFDEESNKGRLMFIGAAVQSQDVHHIHSFLVKLRQVILDTGSDDEISEAQVWDF